MGNDIKPDTIRDIRLYNAIGCNWYKLHKPHNIGHTMKDGRTLNQHIHLQIQEVCADLVTMYLSPDKLFDRANYRLRRLELAQLNTIFRVLEYTLSRSMIYLGSNGKIGYLPERVLTAEENEHECKFLFKVIGDKWVDTFMYGYQYNEFPVTMFKGANETIAVVNGIRVVSPVTLRDKCDDIPLAEFDRVFRVSDLTLS